MAKKQSRRSISVNRSLFDQVTGVAKTRGIPVAQLTDRALRRELTDGGDIPTTTFTGQEAAMLLRGLAALDQVGRVDPNERTTYKALIDRVSRMPVAVPVANDAPAVEPSADGGGLVEKPQLDEIADEDAPAADEDETRVVYDEDAA